MSLCGRQTPTYRTVPTEYSFSYGPRAIKLAKILDIYLDEWQQSAISDALRVKSDGKWAAPDVGLIVPRQNGKGAVLEIVALAALLFVDDVKLILWTAHEHKTAREAFLRLMSLAQHKQMEPYVEQIYTGAGTESIKMKNGSRIQFLARSKASGRGFSADMLILDESYALTDDQLSAILPTILARPNRQIWYTSSAPLLTSEVLRRFCKRGRNPNSLGIVYLEWCADQKDDISSPEVWARANPGMNIRVDQEAIASLYGSMDPEDFQREILGVWLEDAFETVIDLQMWNSIDTDDETSGDPFALSVDVTTDRRFSSICAASLREDGTVLLEVIDHLPGTNWVVPRLVSLVEEHQPCVLVIDSSSPAASLLPDLEAEGLKVTTEPESGYDEIIVKTTTSQLAQACGLFYDAVTGQSTEPLHDTEGNEIKVEVKPIRHLNDPALNAAVEGASQRPLGDAWAWSRKTSASNIAPLVACTLALYGLSVYGAENDPEPFVFFGR